MTITYKGLQSIEGSIDGKDASSSATLTFESECDVAPLTIGDSAITSAVVAATGLGIGSPYPFDSYSWCRKISSRCGPRRMRGANPFWVWSTTMEFSSSTESNTSGGGEGGGGGGGGSGTGGNSTQRDPALRWPKITISTRSFDEPVSRDILNRKVENSAGDPVVRTRKNAHVIFRWEKFLPFFDWQLLRPVHDGGYLYSRNLAPWRPAGPYSAWFGAATIPAGQARMESITADVSFEGARGGGMNVAVEIATDAKEFADVFLDQGFFHLNQAGVTQPAEGQAPATVRRRFVDRNGVMSGPQLLNGFGLPNPVNAAPVEISRQYYDLKDWNRDPWGPTTTRGRFFAMPVNP